MKNIKYSVAFVCHYLEISPHLLRAWEKRYAIVTPSRSTGNQRLYSPIEIEKLFYLTTLVHEGQRISSLAQLNLHELKKMTSKTFHFTPQGETLFNQQELGQLLFLLENFRLNALSFELQKIIAYHSLETLIFHYLIPLLQRLGDLILTKKFDTAHEHAFSSLLRFHLYPILKTEPAASTTTKKAIAFCTLPGDQHEFAILFAALLAKHQKIPIYFLGTNLPLSSLLVAMEGLNCQHIVIGVNPYFVTHHSKFSKTLTELENFPKQYKIILGGKFSEKIFSKNIRVIDELTKFNEYLKYKHR